MALSFAQHRHKPLSVHGVFVLHRDLARAIAQLDIPHNHKQTRDQREGEVGEEKRPYLATD